MSTTTATARIYVTCLAAYSSGFLHGRWIDLAGKDSDAVNAEIQDILNTSPMPNAEEWAIHDFDLKGIKIEEHESIDRVVKLAEMVDEFGGPFIAWFNYYEPLDEPDALNELFTDKYRGEYDSRADYAAELAEETGQEVPEFFRFYIDWDSMAQDWEINGEVKFLPSPGGTVYVFSGY